MLNAMLSLPFWEGHIVDSVVEQDDESLLIVLNACPTADALCGSCRQPCALVHERRWRRIRDRDILDRRVWLKIAIRRLDCHHCNARVTEHISWLDRRSRMTHRVRVWVEALAQLIPIKHVSQLTGLHWHTIKAIDLQRLAHLHGQFAAGDVRRLVMDEFALHKGHRYATVVLDAQRMRVLWVGEGNSRAAIRPFFEALGAEGCDQIEAVAMDMNTAMDLEVRAQCPNAEVVYDLFHVVARFGIVAQRVCLVDTHPVDDRAIKLDELLAANAPLSTVYLLKTELKEIWFAPSVREGARRWKRWMRLALESEIAAVIKFAKRLRIYVRGIIASAIYPMNSSILEGVNNRIKVIKRMAYGFRDSAYFFLKIKDAFPGKAR